MRQYTLLKIAMLFALILFFSSPVFADDPGRLKSDNPVIKSASEYDYPPYCIVTPDNHADGFSVELLRAALDKMGYRVSFEIGQWREVKQSLIDGQVQALPLVGRTPEREELFDFTFPYLRMHGGIVVREDETDIRSLSDLKGRQVAVMLGDNAEEFVRRINLDADIVTTRTFEQALIELSEGLHDAVIIQKLVALQLIEKFQIPGLKIVGYPMGEFVQSFCFAVRKGDSSLLSILNEGLSIAVADGTFHHLQTKWFAPIEALEPQKSRIVIGGDENYPPYEFLDENGQPAGFNVDLSRAIAQRLGIDTKIVLGPWATIKEGVENGDIDILHGMLYSPERDMIYDFSFPHTYINYVIATRDKQLASEEQNFNALSGKTIVLQKGDVIHDSALRMGFENQLVLMGDMFEVLKSLADGQYEYALVPRTTALFLINKHGWKNLYLSDKPVLTEEYCYAAAHGNSKLLYSFEDGLHALKDTGEYREIYAKWLGVYETPDLGLMDVVKYLIMIIAPLLLLLFLSFLWSKTLNRRVKQQTLDLSREVAERNKALKAQKESEDKLKSIFSAAPVGIGYLINRVFLEVNDTLLNMTGYTREELLHQNARILYPTDEDYEHVGREKYRQMAEMGSGAVETRWQRKDGRIIDVYLCSAYLDTNDASKGATLSVLDITERKRLEMERLEMERRLLHSQKLESLGVLAGGIAHDFNNLLAAIIGNLDITLYQLSQVAPARGAIEDCLKAAKRAADLTRQMLAYSGRGHFIVADISLNELIEENLHILKSAVSKNVSIGLSLADDIPCISADVAQVQQVVMNFITNASEAIGEMQGSIHITTGVMDCDEAYLEKSLAEEKPPAGKFVYLEVADTGCGMDEETKQKLFDPFFTTKFTGRGLGMAAVIGIVRGHKGAIFVESEVGKGTTIRVLFSAVERKPEVKAEKLRIEHAETETYQPSDKTVLIVDDEEFVRDMCNDMVMSFGYQTLTAEDGMKAVEIYGEHYKEIDCVILDLSMPRMSGYETFLKLKKLNPDVKVILSSGYEKEEATRKFERESLAGFVQKPYRMKSLRAELAKS